MRVHIEKPLWMFSLLVALLCGAGVTSAQSSQPAGGPLEVRVSQNAVNVPLYEVFELSFLHENSYANPFFDATIDMTFTSPSGKSIPVGGFFYGSDERPRIQPLAKPTQGRKYEYLFTRHNLWKARFAPSELGQWTYTYRFRNAQGQQASGDGRFVCIQSRRPSHGFVRINPDNPMRFMFDDGSPYFPVGTQDGVFDGAGVGSTLATAAMEGPFRRDRRPDWPALPAGAMYQPGPAMNPQNADVQFRRLGQGGFNMLRFSQRNFSLDLYTDLDHYLVQEAIMVDELLLHARKYDYRLMYGLFGYMPVFNDHPDDAEGMAKVKRFIQYSVNRWGAYVDIWELLNEQKADTKWYEITVPYLRSIDPYHHPVTTSWERPEVEGIDINAPHWYQNEDELTSHSETANRVNQWRKAGKPILVGEQGNSADENRAKRAPGVGGVWDIGSARRMRIRLWTAFFNEAAFVFWNTSAAKDAHFMNIWLGPREREYVRALQGFCYSLDKDIRVARVAVVSPSQVRGYAVSSRERAGAYLVHAKDHQTVVKGMKVSLEVPKAGKAYWYDPATAVIVASADAPEGMGTFTAPEFTVDIALLITPDGPPDIDHDGKPNDADDDNDNDGVPNAADAFPLEPSEWQDKDGDLIGDNLDADVDGDGVGDDKNGNGTPDCDESDPDGDGVKTAGAVPWDAFPLDPKEWRDTDGDGIGDNADPDDDNDGWTDAEEIKAGTDPLNRLSFPAK